MKPPLLLNARRPLPSGRRGLLAVVLPARACFVPERTSKRFAVRGSAPPGREARRCSPPTATINRNTNVSTVTVWPFIRGSRLYSSEHENHSQTFGMAMLPVRCGDQPQLDGFPDVAQRFFSGLALAPATGQGGATDCEAFIRFYQ